MLGIFGVFFLAAFVKILDLTAKPVHCAAFYTLVMCIPALALSKNRALLVIPALILFGYISLYFWLLEKYGGWLYWLILIAGAIPVLALGLLSI